MLVEMRTYNIKVGKLKTFISIYDQDIRKTHIEILGNQLGFFSSEIGELNQVIHLYGFNSYEDRINRRKKLYENKDFINYVLKVADLIISQKSQILLLTSFSKIR